MTECDEVARGMMDRYSTRLAEGGVATSPMHARTLVDELMPDESATIRDNVAESLHRMRRDQERVLRMAEQDMAALVERWEHMGVILTVERRPLEPLAMRHTAAHIEARLKR